MPELPEVEVTRLGLLPLVGKLVKSVTIRHPTLRWPIPQHLTQTLPNQSLRGLTRRAKYILCDFGSEAIGNEASTGTLLLHLGMSGRIQLLDCNYPPEKHDHFDIEFVDALEKRFQYDVKKTALPAKPDCGKIEELLVEINKSYLRRVI